MLIARFFFAMTLLIALVNHAFCQALPSAEPNIIVVDPKDPQVSRNPIHVQLAGELSLGLPNTSGTGYIWTSQTDDPTIATCTKAKSIAVKKGNEPVVGYRTLDVFIIASRSAGRTTLRFSLARPNDNELYSLVIPIVVDP
jgi:hypothetical protein